MTKKEKIQEAYGDYWEQVKDYVNIDGWFYLNDTEFRLDNKMPLEFDGLNNKMRPKSLQGIENNNGWIKLPTKDFLKKGEYFVRVGQPNTQNKEIFIHFINEGIGIIPYQYATHYQQIIKPEPPIY